MIRRYFYFEFFLIELFLLFQLQLQMLCCNLSLSMLFFQLLKAAEIFIRHKEIVDVVCVCYTGIRDSFILFF